jgi:hypothetical protein
MAAPTGLPEDPDILSRLTSLVDDVEPAPADPSNAQETKPLPVVDPPDDTPAQVEPGDEPEPLAADDEPEVSSSEIATGAEVDDDEIKTTADLAKMFEIEETALLDNLQVDTGDGNQVALSKILSTYKNAPEAAQRMDQLTVREQQFEAESTQLRTKADEQLREMAAHTQILLDMTQDEFKDVEWKRLEVEDPAHYLILKERQRERGGAIQGAIERMKAIEQDRTGDMQTAAAKNRSAEIATLHTKMPEWTDPVVAKAAMEDTHEALVHYGFSQDEINLLSDHRYLLVAHDAAQFRKLKKQAPQKLETLRNLPKTTSVIRSTARRDTQAVARKSAQKNMDRLRKSGDERDAAKIFEELV